MCTYLFIDMYMYLHVVGHVLSGVELYLQVWDGIIIQVVDGICRFWNVDVEYVYMYVLLHVAAAEAF